MTLKEVLGRVAEIRESARNHALAHTMEDKLYQDVLASIAVNPKDAARLAKAALDTKTIYFERWVE